MFDDVPQTFVILPHGKSKSESSKPFKRTQESNTESIKNRPMFKYRRKALDHVAEDIEGSLTCQNSGTLPRNAA